MKNLVILILVVIIAYYVYTSGILTRAVQTVQTAVPSLPGGNATPEIFVTVYSPYGTGAKTPTMPPPPAAPLPTRNVVVPTARPAPTDTPLPAINAPDAPTALPVVITPPPPTIVMPETPPTLAVANTPTPSSVFTITLETPHDGDTLRASPTLVIGNTAPNAVVSINDVVGLAGPDGHFALAVPLQPGPNVLEIIASKPNGDQTFIIVTVLYQS